MTDEKDANRLIHETSPYLLQHARNPVDWYPWGEAAFQIARAEDKPVFVSIGYSACHWCHVMERESFEDQAVADILNRAFVSVKVDREERPDVDHLYMQACQLMTGSGGWPLTIIAAPDKRPFFAGTYFPKEDRGGRRGLLTLLPAVEALWRTDRASLLSRADAVLQALGPERAPKEKSHETSLPRAACEELKDGFDAHWGGFSPAPKFPMPSALLLLLRRHAAQGDEVALSMTQKTLEAMARGGIYDSVGLGFCRYATDRRWLVPHFEKMLYDNAQLALVYAEAFRITGRAEWADTARGALGYMEDRLLSPEGGFYTAEDADAAGVEGSFYTWTPEEVSAALGKDGPAWCRLYGVTQAGNFEGRSIPNLLGGPVPEDQKDFAEGCRQVLYGVRAKRPRPLRDEKILVGLNGLAIAALATAGRLLGEPHWLELARRAAAFAEERLTMAGGRLWSAWPGGPDRQPAFAQDYAYLAWGLLELYGATLEPAYLARAKTLTDGLLDLFYDEEDGGVYMTARDGGALPIRPRDDYDGAVPSAGAVAAYNMIRLSRLYGDGKLEATARRVIDSLAGGASPWAHCFAALAALWLDTGGADVTLTGGKFEDLSPFLTVLNGRYRPFVTVRAATADRPLPPGISAPPPGDAPAAHVCANGACLPPIGTPQALAALLDESSPAPGADNGADS